MLIAALVLFTAVALVGLKMAGDLLQSKQSGVVAKALHAGLALAGSLLVIVAALKGDAGLWINIAMALVIIPLGVALFLRRRGGFHPRGLLLAHGGLAAVCFGFLAYYAYPFA